MRCERGSALVEAVAILPLCVVCGLALVDCGILVRDRMAVAQAASRAAAAAMSGGDVELSARGALPRSVTHSLRVRRNDRTLELSIVSRPAALGRIAPVALTSRVELPAEVTP